MEFKPYFQPYQKPPASEQLANVSQNVGNMTEKIFQGLLQQKEKQRQDRLAMLTMGNNAMQNGLSPEAAQAQYDFYKTGNFPQSTLSSPSTMPPNGSQMPVDASSGPQAPSMAPPPPSRPLFASAGIDDMGNSIPTPQHTVPVTNLQGKIDPKIYDMVQRAHPNGQMDSTMADTYINQHNPQQPQQNVSRGTSLPTGFGALFQRKPLDYAAAIKRMKGGDYSDIAGYNEKQLKGLEAVPEYQQMKKKEDQRTFEQAHYLLPQVFKDKASFLAAYPTGYIDKEDLASAVAGINQSRGAGKEDTSQLKDMQDAFNKDKNVVQAQGTLDKLEQARGLLQAGTINNTTAKQALTTALTFVSTGAQRVNETELRAFMGGQTKTNKLNQWFKSIDDGTLTARDAQDMAGVIDIYAKAAQKNLKDRGMSYARQLGQRTGNKPEMEYKRLTGEDYQTTPAGGNDPLGLGL